MRGEERGPTCMQQSFSMSLSIAAALCNLHAHSRSGNGLWKPRIVHRDLEIENPPVCVHPSHHGSSIYLIRTLQTSQRLG